MRLYRHLDMPSDGHMRLMKERFTRWRNDPYWYVTVSCLADDARADQYRGYAEFWRRYDSWESTLIASRTRLGRRLSRAWWRLLFTLDPPNRLEREVILLLDDRLRRIGDSGLGMDKWVPETGNRSSER